MSMTCVDSRGMLSFEGPSKNNVRNRFKEWIPNNDIFAVCNDPVWTNEVVLYCQHLFVDHFQHINLQNKSSDERSTMYFLLNTGETVKKKTHFTRKHGTSFVRTRNYTSLYNSLRCPGLLTFWKDCLQ